MSNPSIYDMFIIRPVAIVAAMLTGGAMPAEPHPTYDPPAWNGATLYAIGDPVAYAAAHRVYQRKAAGTTATTPDADPANWTDIGATDRYKPFDGIYQAQAQNADHLVYEFTLGAFADTLVLLNAQCVTAQLTTAAGYDSGAISMLTRTVRDMWEYFTEPFVYRADYAFMNVPIGTSTVATLTLTNVGGVPALGECIVGLSKRIGGTQYGARAGFLDYSVKAKDAFGNYTVAERAYSKTMSISVLVDNTFIDELQRLIISYRAKPLVFLGAGNLYECLINYGYAIAAEVAIPYPANSILSLQTEALT